MITNSQAEAISQKEEMLEQLLQGIVFRLVKKTLKELPDELKKFAESAEPSVAKDAKAMIMGMVEDAFEEFIQEQEDQPWG